MRDGGDGCGEVTDGGDGCGVVSDGGYPTSLRSFVKVSFPLSRRAF